MNDNEIIDMYWQRNEHAITCTDQKYGKYLETISYNITHNIEDVMECKNDTYLNTWNTIPPKKPPVLKHYLGMIIRNVSLSLFRKKHTQKRVPEDFISLLSELDDTIPSVSNVENALAQGELIKLINTFLINIPVEKRVMFVKRYWYCESIETIAKSFGCTESKVKSALHYTRTKLKAYLEEEGVVI